MEIDLLAKLYWQEQFGAPVVNLLLEHEFWTFCIHGKKVSSYLNRQIRNHVNGGAQCKQWERKGQLLPETFTTIHWDACEQAMLKVSEGQWCWMAKHVSGHAGVGMKLLQWQQCDDD